MDKDKAEKFIRELAEEAPIIPTYCETNECKFCRQSWAEDTYAEYLKNVKILKENREALQPNKIHRVAWEHHDDDCLWVRANELIS